jgi:hypothetical protein
MQHRGIKVCFAVLEGHGLISKIFHRVCNYIYITLVFLLLESTSLVVTIPNTIKATSSTK